MFATDVIFIVNIYKTILTINTYSLNLYLLSYQDAQIYYVANAWKHTSKI